MKNERTYEGVYLIGYFILGCLTIMLFQRVFFDFSNPYTILVIVLGVILINRWLEKENKKHRESLSFREWKRENFTKEELDEIDRNPDKMLDILENREKEKLKNDLRKTTPYQIHKKKV